MHTENFLRFQLCANLLAALHSANARLTGLGLESDEAKSQIAVCLSEEMEKILKLHKPFDEVSYRAALDALPLEEEELLEEEEE